MAFAGAGAANEEAANAIKASGVLVRVEPQEFVKILARANNPLVVISEGGLFSTNFRYLMSYKGLAFFTKSDDMLALPADAEVIRAREINIPG
jgi:hypothetical protein